jgi:glycosyltransferase involved in cell wall biosynthesis
VRVAICGNIANNAYSLAKGLRALGVEADSFDQGSGWIFSLPIWEEGEFDLRDQEDDNPALEYWETSRIKTENHWQRPPWAKILGNDGKAVRHWYDTQEDFERDVARVQLRRAAPRNPTVQQYGLSKALTQSRTPEHLWEDVIDYHKTSKSASPDWQARRDTIVKGGYDLAVLCGYHAAGGTLLPRDIPYITFEHSTMRDTPYLRTLGQRVLACAYELADWNVVTNADCWEAAGMLGIRHKSSFIPHPFDEQKFSPETEANRTHLRPFLRDQLQCEVLFLAPARHSSNEAVGAKRNDRILYAFHRYVTEAEPAGAPKAGLVLFAWGNEDDLTASRGLIDVLGLTERVNWQPPQPRPRLVQFYRAADIVLDQFSEVGSFGTTTVEAMSCGKPVITYYSPQVHEWCLPVLGEHPPVLSARTVDEIYERLVWQAKHERYRADIGRRGREWVLRHHSLERVAKAHLSLYTRVLAQKAVKRTPAKVDISQVRNTVVVTA